MEIIDSKGRLFGKINLIDFLVLSFLLCLVPTFFFIWKISSNKRKATMVITNEITLNCNFVKINPDVLEQIKVGDHEVFENGEVIGEIIWLGESQPYAYEFDIGSGSVMLKEDSGFKSISAMLKLKVQSENNKIFYHIQPILTGKPFIFRTAKYSLNVIPVEEHRITQNLNFNAIFKNLDEQALNLITIGDKDVNAEGIIMAEVLDLGKIANNAYNIDLGGGNFFVGEDTSGKKQIYVTMRLRCEILGSKIFFKGESMNYDSRFEFKTNKYKVTAALGKSYLKYSWIKVSVKFKDVIPEMSRLIKEGDIQRDIEGVIIGKVGKILNSYPSPVSTVKDDRVLEIPHPFMKDMVLLLDLMCLNRDGLFYFGNYPVKVGNTVTFSTDVYSFAGTVVGVEMQ